MSPPVAMSAPTKRGLLLLGALLLSCVRARTELVVLVDADPLVPAMASLSIEVRRGDATAALVEAPRTWPTAGTPFSLPMTVGLSPTDQDAPETLWIEVRGCRGVEGCGAEGSDLRTLAVARARVRYEAESSLWFRMNLTAACGSACPTDATCDATTRQCRSAQVAPAELHRTADERIPDMPLRDATVAIDRADDAPLDARDDLTRMDVPRSGDADRPDDATRDVRDVPSDRGDMDADATLETDAALDVGAPDDARVDVRDDVADSADGATTDDASCADDAVRCGDACVALGTLEHCATCEHHCPLDPTGTVTCVMGTCITSPCPSGLLNCNNVAGDGCEVDLASNIQHCGGCGRVCGTTNTLDAGCVDGGCVLECFSGYEDCDRNAANGCEGRLLDDPTNCGRCGRVCDASADNAGGQSCASGRCYYGYCLTGFLDCDGDRSNGCEIDARSDNRNCGACGLVCDGGVGCAEGRCR